MPLLSAISIRGPVAAGANTQGVGNMVLAFIHKDVQGEDAGAFPASCFCKKATCRASRGLSGSARSLFTSGSSVETEGDIITIAIFYSNPPKQINKT